MSGGLYERQQQWREHTQRKYDRARSERLQQEDEALTFNPVMATNGGRGGNMPLDDRLQSSSQRHIERQRRARLRREELQAAFASPGTGEATPGSPGGHTRGSSPARHTRGSSPARQPVELSKSNGSMGRELFMSRDAARPPSEGSPLRNGETPDWMLGEVPYDQYDDETFYEQLQRERREWARERERLLRVIELQQMELSKRSSAVRDKAASIAQSFSATVSTFEERLTELESSVASELRMLRQRGALTSQQSKLSAASSKPSA